MTEDTIIKSICESQGLAAIDDGGWERYRAISDDTPGGASQRLYRQWCTRANHARDNHLKKNLAHLFDRLPNQGQYMAYRLTKTNRIFLIRRNRGRKDIRYGFLTTTEGLGQHWMNWRALGDLSGVGGLFLSGLRKLLGEVIP